MFKCPFCPAEIDELRVIDDEDAGSRKKHAAALGEWRQMITLIGNRAVHSAHVCPDHAKLDGGLTVSLAGKK